MTVPPGPPGPITAGAPPPVPDPATAAAPSAIGPRHDRRRVWMLILISVLIAAAGIGVLIWISARVGSGTGLVVGSAAAVLPVPLLVGCFLWLDRYAPEPLSHLVFCLTWGAFVATGLAVLGEWGSSYAIKAAGWSSTLVLVVVAPAIEETMKALGPVLLLRARRRAISGIVDGIVYCGISATGFAMVENILYLGKLGYAANAERAGVAGGVSGLISVFLVRIALSAFAHPLFTSMTGIGLGIAARARRRAVRVLAPIAGLVVAMTLHGAWNLMSVLAKQVGAYVVLYGYFSVMMPIFFGMVGYALWLRGSEARLTQRILPAYAVAGWFTPPEVASLATIGRRMSARTWAKRVAGARATEAMRGFQFAATKLALLRDGLTRGLRSADLADALAEERALLTEIGHHRLAYVGRDPAVPRTPWDGRHYHVAFPDGLVRLVPAPPTAVVPIAVNLAPPIAAYPGAPYPPGPYPAAPYLPGPYPAAPYLPGPYPAASYPPAPYPAGPYPGGSQPSGGR